MNYNINIDNFERNVWEKNAKSFLDYNIYQTWAYQLVRAETDNCIISRAIIEDSNNEVVLMCHVRIKSVFGFKIGYVQWGPIYRKSKDTVFPYDALKELSKEYLNKKINILLITPPIFDNDPTIDIKLNELGFNYLPDIQKYQTLILYLHMEDKALKSEMHKSWRKNLNKAESNHIDIRASKDIASLYELKKLYSDLKNRKNFRGVDPDIFIKTQSRLIDSEKMEIITAYIENEPIFSHAISHLGDTTISLLAAGNEKGLEYLGSFLVWWQTVISGKNKNMSIYDLGGIDKKNNPNVYLFKSRMGATEVSHIGTYEIYKNIISFIFWTFLRKTYNIMKK